MACEDPSHESHDSASDTPTRRYGAVEIAFVGAVLLAGLFAALLLFGALRGNRGRTFVAMLGFVALMAFVAIRAAGFHHMDALIKAEVGPMRMNWILELGPPIGVFR